MKPTGAKSTTSLTTERASSTEGSFTGTGEDMSCLEKLVAELLLKNQQLRFKLLAAEDRIERQQFQAEQRERMP